MSHVTRRMSFSVRYKDAVEFKSLNGYEVGGAWYPRVTRILEIKSKPALDAFFREVETYAAAEDIKNKSAAEGSLVHEVIQKIATGIPVDVPETIRPAADAFQQFNAVRKIYFYPEFIERQVWSLRHRYAGTVDALASIDGKFGVLDIKTATGFYPEYNLQTAAYVSALQEFPVRQALSLPCDIETRWILRVNQHRKCKKCSSTLREKGGRSKIRNGRAAASSVCTEEEHAWGDVEGEIELKEFPYFFKDMKAFVAAKILWEWEHDYWLRNIGYFR